MLALDGVGATVGHGLEGAHALGDLVAEPACGLDDLVQLQMQVTEVLADDAPMRLLPLHMELDEVDEDLLQIVAELVGCLHDAAFRSACVF